MSSGRLALLFAFALAVNGVMIAVLFRRMMIEEILRVGRDRESSRAPKFPAWNAWSIYRRYRSSVPNGRLHVQACWVFALAIAGLVGVAVMLRTAHVL